MNIGKSIKIAMVKRDMRQQKLADMVGVRRTYISQLCNGRAKPSQDLTERLAKATGYSVSEFIALGE